MKVELDFPIKMSK